MIHFFGVMGILFCCVLAVAAVFGVFEACDWVKTTTRKLESLEQDYRDMTSRYLNVRHYMSQTDDQVKQISEQIAEIRMKEPT